MAKNIYELLECTSEEFLNGAYKYMFGREIDREGREHYLAQLVSGANRVDVLYDLSRSSENNLDHDTRSRLARIFKANGNIGMPMLRPFRRRRLANSRAKENLIGILSAIRAPGATALPAKSDPIATPKAGADLNHSTQEHKAPVVVRAKEPPPKAPASTPVSPSIKYPTPVDLGAAPLISIIVVNYNGERHLRELGECLAKQTYKNFEVIFVDNNSSDESISVAKKAISKIKIIASEKNFGFAEANNIGQEAAAGELLLLMNNDISFGPSLIEDLLQGFGESGKKNVAAIIPKILFYKDFVTVKVTSDDSFRLNEKELFGQLSDYKKLIPLTKLQDTHKEHRFMVPVGTGKLKMTLAYEQASDADINVTISDSEQSKVRIEFKPGNKKIVTFDCKAGKAQPIINNAGSYVTHEGECGDIGIYEVDEGQYDTPNTRDALCGCVALIRRSALGNYPLFAPDFFAYYEDSELSIRLRSGGWLIYYHPTAVVRHKHASTSSDKSLLFKRLVAKNRLGFMAIHFPHLLEAQLAAAQSNWKHLEHSAANGVKFEDVDLEFIRGIPDLRVDTLGFIGRVKSGLIFSRGTRLPSIGIYNLYWNTKGGGELRALYLAEALSKYARVDLISTHDFDLDGLRAYFNLKLEGVRKIIVGGFSSQDTKHYDVFVNTTHHSNLISRAHYSVYLLSFPHRHVTPECLASYNLILANSDFTAEWTKTYWGNWAPVEVLYPPIDARGIHAFSTEQRDSNARVKNILSVGRFFKNGHNKRQLEMIEVFKKIGRKRRDFDWKLTLVGSVNLKDPDSVGYLAELYAAAEGENIEILTNCSRNRLLQLLSVTPIYWHASGLGVASLDPESMEHFGMAIAEAISAGCVPVAFSGGGIPEVLGAELSSLLFADEDGLVANTERLMDLFECSSEEFFDLSAIAAEQGIRFDVQQHNARIDSIFAPLVRMAMERKARFSSVRELQAN
ncbi:glycosyltransferase [Paraburkholderia sp. Ac-20342]|uniref:glycosyltransferase n=1 Tax=Paraburkholderia sp. Ac-20342 TaxID=2703889 RepID=UPI00197E49D0|nr:glycosyltransferase [Paraburkholderia sp. Ac-20342]MBN3849915.1 glycosyltransferase [Paraburkholderia sp. Ac-20342]